jgi:predicted nucleotidyltransferase
MEVTNMNQALKAIRENLGLTQLEVSKLVGIPINTIRNWELDEETGILSFLTIKNRVAKIAEKYDIERIYLFGSYVNGQAKENSDIDLYMKSNLYGLEYFEFIELLRETLKKQVEVLSNKTVQEHSKIDREIKKTGVLIYER